MTRSKKFFTDERIALIIRWWAVGAVYFFIGWGTNLSQRGIIDFAFFLGLSIGIFNMLVVNPVIRMVLKTKATKGYMETSIKDKVIGRMTEIVKSILIVVLMTYIYNIANTLLIALLGLGEESIPLPGEPITFGIIYILIWSLINGLVASVKKRISEHER